MWGSILNLQKGTADLQDQTDFPSESSLQSKGKMTMHKHTIHTAHAAPECPPDKQSRELSRYAMLMKKNSTSPQLLRFGLFQRNPDF